MGQHPSLAPLTPTLSHKGRGRFSGYHARMTGLFEAQAPRPLADRLRPRTLAEVIGQDHLLGQDGPIGRMIAARSLASMVLWGPPGCGKTTIARLLAETTDLHFEPISAVFSGVAELRKIFDAARKRRLGGQGTLLFVDEIQPPRTRPSSSTARSCRAAKSSSSTGSTRPRSTSCSNAPRRSSAAPCRSRPMRASPCATWPTATGGSSSI